MKKEWRPMAWDQDPNPYWLYNKIEMLNQNGEITVINPIQIPQQLNIYGKFWRPHEDKNY